MTNLEYIRALNEKELAEKIYVLYGHCVSLCSFCVFYRNKECSGECRLGISEWLKEERE